MRANRYVSYLAAEIEPKAIATLNQWERDATKVMERIATAGSKGTAGQARSAIFGNQARELQNLARSVDPAVRKVNELDRSTRRAAEGAGVMTTSFKRAGQALNIVQGPLGPLAGRLSALSDVMQTLTGYSLAGVLGGGGAFALGSIASQYQNMTDRLRPLYDSQEHLNSALENVVGIAQRSRQALEPVVELYAKMTLAGRAAGISDERSARIAELASKAARISGGRAATQEAGLTQFAQGFGSGTLSGEELKSIKENTLFLAKSIADGLGVPIAKLKELGAEGKLTPQVIEAALLRSAESIDGAFAKLPKRIGSSLTELSTNFTVFVGKLDDSVGATTTIANALSFLASNLDLVTVAVTATAAAFTASSIVRFGEMMLNAGRSATIAAKNTFDLARAVTAGNAVILDSVQANQMRAQHIAEGARVEAAAAQQSLRNSQAYKTQIQSQISLLDKQIATQRRNLEQARTFDAALRAQGGGNNQANVKRAQEELNASLRARMMTERQLVAVNAELAASETRLTGATTALTIAEERLVVADTAAAASSGRLTAAKMVLLGAFQRVTAAASSLVAFLGGPWGVAFTIGAGLVAYLTSQTNAAAEAARQFEGDQASLAQQLGFTTGQLMNQSAAARQLAIDLARVELLKAKEKFTEQSYDAAGVLKNRAFFNTTSVQDTATLVNLANVIERQGALSSKGYAELSAVIRKYPSLQKDKELLETIVGLKVATSQANKAIEDAGQVVAAAQKPIPAQPNLGGGTKPKTTAQLNREAAVAAAKSPLDRARAELALAKAEGKKGGETDEQYIARIAEMTRSVKSLADAEKGAAGARSSGAAAMRRAAAEIESASDKADRLAGIMDRYSADTPVRRLERLRDEAEKAKRAIDDLIGEKVEGFDGAFSAADAESAKDQIDRSVEEQARRPVTDSIRDGRERLQILDLEARGMGELAELTRRRLDLEKEVGELYPEEVDAIRQQIDEETRLNDILYERNRIIENNARFLGEVRDAGRDAIRSFLDGDIGGGIKQFAKRLSDAYKDALAEEISFTLFGDPEKKYRDEMTRGLNQSADNLTGSSRNLDSSAASLERAADAIAQSAAASMGGGPIVSPEGTLISGGMDGGLMGAIFGDLSGVLYNLDSTLRQTTGVYQEGEDIVVQGKRDPVRDQILMPGGIDTIIGPAISSILSSIGIKGDIGRVIGSAIGSVLGAGKQGGALSGIAGLGNIFGNSGLGSVLGAGLMGGLSGGVQGALSGIGGAAGKLLGNAILPGIGGAIGGVLGSIGGSLLGGLFGKKTKKGSATITDLSGDFKLGGNSGKYKSASSDAADSVVGGLQRIVDALGGSVGAFAVSIGVRNGDWRVDPSGRGKTKKKSGAIDFDDDAEAAIRFAIMNAIQDGAIQGIRESTRRLLMAGKDLDAALEKALRFEDVFRRLKKFKDPVGAAIDDLNREFAALIKIFQEAGASAEEWAQLEELYGLERAEAIKQATEAASQVLQDFIQSITSGPESPLSRRTVYDNAKAEVDKFRADIAAGRPVDQDAFVQALENYQSASAELNGSRAQFYQDFADILALANAALANVPTPGDGSLPASPFDNLDTTNQIIQEGVNQQVITNQLLASMIAAIQGGGSTVGQLPTAEATPSSLGGGWGGVWGDNLNVRML